MDSNAGSFLLLLFGYYLTLKIPSFCESTIYSLYTHYILTPRFPGIRTLTNHIRVSDIVGQKPCCLTVRIRQESNLFVSSLSWDIFITRCLQTLQLSGWGPGLPGWHYYLINRTKCVLWYEIKTLHPKLWSFPKVGPRSTATGHRHASCLTACRTSDVPKRLAAQHSEHRGKLALAWMSNNQHLKMADCVLRVYSITNLN